MTSTDDIADQPPGVAGQKIASALLSRVPALADELPSPSPVEPIDGNVKQPDRLVEAATWGRLSAAAIRQERPRSAEVDPRRARYSSVRTLAMSAVLAPAILGCL